MIRLYLYRDHSRNTTLSTSTTVSTDRRTFIFFFVELSRIFFFFYACPKLNDKIDATNRFDFVLINEPHLRYFFTGHIIHTHMQCCAVCDYQTNQCMITALHVGVSSVNGEAVRMFFTFTVLRSVDKLVGVCASTSCSRNALRSLVAENVSPP